MAGHVPRLVGLDRPDEMPHQARQGQGGNLLKRLLHIVFAEITLACLIGFPHRVGTLGLAHSQQCDRFGRTPAGLCRPGNLLSYPENVFCYARHVFSVSRPRGHAHPQNHAHFHAGAATKMDITELLGFSVKQGASDLHITAGMPPLIRVDGDMRKINVPPMDHKEVHALIYEIMTDKQRKDYEQFMETDFSFEVPGLARFRVNAFNQNRGAAAVFRTIPSKVLSMEQLGMGPVFKQVSDLARGLVVVTGPTGSGKSTTLAAMMDYVNSTRYEHILTIEDPIEFVHESKKCLVNQREVHRDTLGFQEALRSALREDPDIILVGELRDLETIRLALTAAETGHLVFGTLHTTSAAKTIDRIIDVFPAAEKSMVRSMLSESLQAVISQALLKKTGGGRIAAHEIMIGTPAIRNLIREDKVAQMYSAIQTGSAVGMKTLDQTLKELVQKGLITKEAAKAKAKQPDAF